jgi:hypothetical protein
MSSAYFKTKTKNLNYNNHNHDMQDLDSIILLLIPFLTCSDYVSLMQLNDSYYQSLNFNVTCWKVLYQRDYCHVNERLLHTTNNDRKQLYIKAYKSVQNWKLGKSLPPISFGAFRRQNRLLVTNDMGVIAEIGIRDGFCQTTTLFNGITNNTNIHNNNHQNRKSLGNSVYIQKQIAEGEGSSPTSQNSSSRKEFHPFICDCTLGSGSTSISSSSSQYPSNVDRVHLFCGGFEGAWLCKLACDVGEDDNGTLSSILASQLYQEDILRFNPGPQYECSYTVRKIGEHSMSLVCAALDNTGNDCLIWDINRPDIPITCIYGKEHHGPVISVNILSPQTCAVIHEDGNVNQFDFRAGGEQTGSINCQMKQSLVAAHCNSEMLIVSDYSSCMSYDWRMNKYVHRLNQWNVPHVSSLACVNSCTSVAVADGWEGPIVVLNQDHSHRRLQYSGERNYGITKISTNATTLAASCTDRSRIFSFSL